MMGNKGLTDASKLAILNANYMAKRLEVGWKRTAAPRGAVQVVAKQFLVFVSSFSLTRLSKCALLAESLPCTLPRCEWDVCP